MLRTEGDSLSKVVEMSVAGLNAQSSLYSGLTCVVLRSLNLCIGKKGLEHKTMDE